MFPPPCHGGIVSSTSGLAVQHADAGRREHLVPGERVEVGVQAADVDRQVRDGLGAVDEHPGPGRCAPAITSPTGTMVPSTLDTCETATRRVRSLSRSV